MAARTARGGEYRRALIEAAARAFDTGGYAAASCRQIATAAGTDLAVLTSQFRRKDDLALAVVVEQNRRMVATLDRALLRHGPLEALIHGSREIADQMLGADPTVRAGVRLTMELGPFDEAVAEQYRGWIEHVSGLFARAQEAGDVSDRLDPGELGATFVPYFTGVHTMSAVLTGRADLYARLAVMWRTLIDAAAPLGRRIGLHTVTRDAFGEQAVSGEIRVVAGAA